MKLVPLRAINLPTRCPCGTGLAPTSRHELVVIDNKLRPLCRACANRRAPSLSRTAALAQLVARAAAVALARRRHHQRSRPQSFATN